MKESYQIAQNSQRTKNSLHNNIFRTQIQSHKKIINLIKTNHQIKLKNSNVQFDKNQVLNQAIQGESPKILCSVEKNLRQTSQSLPKDKKNMNVSDTDKMLYEKKFKNFLNHREQFENKAQQRRQKLMQIRKRKQKGNQKNQQYLIDQYVNKQELLRDSTGQNQFLNAQQMLGFYEQMTFGKKNKKNNLHLYNAQKIEYLFRRQEFDYLVILQSGENQRNQENQLPTLITEITKNTLLEYLFDEPAVMMLYSINPYQLGDELAEFQTANTDQLTFQEFSTFLLIDREPTYFEYSKQNLDEAREIGRGIKCQKIVSKWISDSQTYDWLLNLFTKVDILGENKADRQILSRTIRKQAEKKRFLDEEIIEIVNINKRITLDRILYEIQYSSMESEKITLEQFKRLLQSYHRLKTPQKDKLTTKLILSGKYDPSYIFILGNEAIETIKQVFYSIQKFAEYFVPRQKFVEKLIKNSKYSKIRNQLVRSQSNRYIKKQTVEQTLMRLYKESEIYIDIEEILDFFTNRGRPRKVQHQIYITNLRLQLNKIQLEQKHKLQKQISFGDYSTSSDQEQHQKNIKIKNIQRKKNRLALIRATQNFTEGKKFNITVPNTFSFGDGIIQKTKVTIRQNKLKKQLQQKTKIQNQAMRPIKPKPVPQHVKEDLYEKIIRQQQRQRKQRLQRFRLQIQESMYPISPHLLSKPKSKSVYEQVSFQSKFIAKPLPWYCQVNLLEGIQRQKDQRRQKILEQIINKHNDQDLPQGFKKMIERSEEFQSRKEERGRALSKTTTGYQNDLTFNPKITSSIPNFQMIHQHLKIDLQNRKQQKKPIKIEPFSFQTRPHRSQTAVDKTSLNQLKRSKQSEIQKKECQVNIPITQKCQALINLRKKQGEEKRKKINEEKRASTVRKMRQQKFAPYVREVLRKSRHGDVAQSRAIIQSKIRQFKKEERKRKRQYEQEMIKIYTKVFNRPLLVEGQGINQESIYEDQQRTQHQIKQDRMEPRNGKRLSKKKGQMEQFAGDYEIPEEQYSKRNPQKEDYEDVRRKAIEHPPRNYLIEEPDQNGYNHDEQDYEGEYLSENGRYTN